MFAQGILRAFREAESLEATLQSNLAECVHVDPNQLQRGENFVALRKYAYAIYCKYNGCKNGNLQMNICYIFLNFAKTIDHGYTLEPPQEGGPNEHPRSIF